MIYEVGIESKTYDSGDMRHRYGKSIDSVTIIKNFLTKNPRSTLAKIYNEFQFLKSTYSKKAINLMLKKLEAQTIIKNTEPKGRHPKYELIDTSEFYNQRDGYAFKDQISANELSFNVESSDYNMIKQYPDNWMKKTISESIFNFGIISLYTCLASYRRSTSLKNSPAKNKKLRELWLRNSMSFENNIKHYQKFSGLLDKKLSLALISKKYEAKLNEDSKNTKEEDVDYSIKKITPKEMIDTVKELENTFAKMFPEWYDSFQSSEDLIDNHVNDLMRKVCINHPEYLLK